MPLYRGEGSCKVEVAGSSCLNARQHDHPALLGSFIPSGPVISNVFGSSVVTIPFTRVVGGSRILRSTPSGIGKGALPIRDRALEVQENGLIVCVEDRAGTRKSGRSIEMFFDLARRQLDLTIMMW